MLVLSRKIGEQIRIGDNVTITINRIRGNRVLLGIEAPQNLHIVRGELKPLTASAENGHPATDSDIQVTHCRIPNLRSGGRSNVQPVVSLPNEPR